MATPLASTLDCTTDEQVRTTLECTAGFYQHTEAGQIAIRLLTSLNAGFGVSPWDWDELQDAISAL